MPKMNIILFDDPKLRNQLKPLTLTRPIADLRLGIFKISEKWEKRIGNTVSFLTENYLDEKFPKKILIENVYCNASVIPNDLLLESIKKLKNESVLKQNNVILAYKTSENLEFGFEPRDKVNVEEYKGPFAIIEELPDLFLKNADEIKLDFEIVKKNSKSEIITDKATIIYNEKDVFVEKGVNIKAAILNAENGPIYIGQNAILQEGAIIIGPVAIGTDAMIGFGAKIRPNTSIGNACRVAGEVGNTIFHSYSNKAHDGFLGNSYIGAWCNLGANTNNSNLKNDYKSVKLYDYHTKVLKDSGEVFCGTFMGDYSKAGISTMFNTGTVVGVSCNVFGAGFQEKYIPSFSWGGKNEGYEVYKFNKAIEVINATMDRKGLNLESSDMTILKHISEIEKMN
jgi:UDP-N-acetylglucosamine diphosphorylase/glucosamine-1-phosphate N-acetyltransferase